MKLRKLLSLLLAIVMIASVAFITTGCADTTGEQPADPTPVPADPTPDPTPEDPGEPDEPDEPYEPELDPNRIHPGLEVMDALLATFGQTLENNNPILQSGDEGNTLRVLTGSASTFPGLFNVVLSQEAFDSQIMDLQYSPFVSYDGSWMWTDDGIATLRFDAVNDAVEFNMQADVNWHDGEPLTLDDLVFAYELMAMADLEGVGERYGATSFSSWIIGIEEFREGEADHISGMVLSNNNRTLRIYYDQPLPPSAQYAGSIWVLPTPRHHIEPVLVEGNWGAFAEHPRARHEALGYGPWIIESIVPGESVLFRANDDYYRGRPNIDYLLWQIRPMEIFMEAFRGGEYDIIANGFGAVQMEEHDLFNADNYTLLALPGTGTGFMYVRQGEFIDGEVVMFEPGFHPVQDVAIRRALFHAMPQELIGATVQNNLVVPAGTVLSPHNARAMINPDIGGAGGMWPFDLDVSRAILDEAGYTEFGADGFRLDLDGNPMYFNFAANDNAFNREAVPTYLQYWRDIGLDVRLYQDDLIEWGVFLENNLLSDNWSREVQLFISNWSLGANPAPHGLWSHDAGFNMPRYMTPEMRGILDDMLSPQAFDDEFLQDAYDRWQIYFYENAISQHMWWGLSYLPVNHRVANATVIRESGLIDWVQRSHTLALTAPTPYANTN